MNAEDMWRRSGLKGAYTAWSFGGAPDELARLTLQGRKTATASAFPLYALTGEPLPQPGEYSVVLDGRDEAVCVIQTTCVALVPFCRVGADHARKEGEGDLSLAYWRKIHRDFFTQEMESAGLKFDETMEVVCEEFVKVFPPAP